MEQKLLSNCKPEELAAAVAELVGNGAVKSLLILACDADGHRKEKVDPILTACPKPVFGGIFPQIIHDNTNLEKGTLLVGLPFTVEPAIIENISDPATDFDEALSEHYADTDLNDKTFFVLLDGLSKRISTLIEAIFNNYGLYAGYIGGGAGSLSFVPAPCIFTNRGLLTDAAILALAPLPGKVGVAHGWQPVTEPMKVTRADKNVVHELDYRPAFEVYREIVEANNPVRFTADNFFDIAKGFPLGLNKLDGEMVVRDPIVRENNALICVGEVPENSYVRILNGNEDSLVAGACSARDLAWDGKPPAAADFTFFVDCISRVLFLGERFRRELTEVAAGRPLSGALTLGEIANQGDAFLEFYNKTAVYGVIHGRDSR